MKPSNWVAVSILRSLKASLVITLLQDLQEDRADLAYSAGHGFGGFAIFVALSFCLGISSGLLFLFNKLLGPAAAIAFADFESTQTGKKDFAFDAFEEDKEGLWFSHFRRSMNPRRDMRNNRVALFDGIEEGGIRASSSYSHEIDEHENERAMEGLQDRVNLLKRLSGDIHEEVDSHNRMLDRMGNDMDSSRGILSGTMDKFKMVFETKSSRRMFTLVASFVVIFLVIYYLTK
ncbi:hypothetical protein GQ457_06G028920 [Hibiscus cannabinus]